MWPVREIEKTHKKDMYGTSLVKLLGRVHKISPVGLCCLFSIKFFLAFSDQTIGLYTTK